MNSSDRNFYRLEDDIRISLRIVSNTDVQIHDPDDFLPRSTSFQLSKELHVLELESAEILHQLHEQNRSFTNLYKNINKRMELIGRAIIANSKDDSELTHSHSEISEGGLSFTTHEVIKKGQFLALRLIFHPSLLGISCFAEVMRCSEVSREIGYKIGTRFVEMDLNTQRQVSRHIIRRQAEIRRERLKHADTT